MLGNNSSHKNFRYLRFNWEMIKNYCLDFVVDWNTTSFSICRMICCAILYGRALIIAPDCLGSASVTFFWHLLCHCASGRRMRSVPSVLAFSSTPTPLYSRIPLFFELNCEQNFSNFWKFIFLFNWTKHWIRILTFVSLDLIEKSYKISCNSYKLFYVGLRVITDQRVDIINSF